MNAAIATCMLALACSLPSMSRFEVEPQGPSIPFEDAGACPFEGCMYRDWIARSPVEVRAEPHAQAVVGFRIQTGETVSALTGIVITTKPGRVRFRRDAVLRTADGDLRVEAGETLLLLTYHGEGYTTAWFRGRVYRELDGSMAFFNAVCRDVPQRCSGEIVEKPEAVWWVQVRNGRDEVGWTNEAEKFDGRRALDSTARTPLPDLRRRLLGAWSADRGNFDWVIRERTILFESDMLEHPYWIEGNVLVIDPKDSAQPFQRTRIVRITSDELEIEDERFGTREVLYRLHKELAAPTTGPR